MGWAQWAPPFAPHVRGEVEDASLDEDGVPRPRSVRATCTICGGNWQGECRQGRPREHVATFAAVHASCRRVDPFAAKKGPPKLS